MNEIISGAIIIALYWFITEPKKPLGNVRVIRGWRTLPYDEIL